LAINAARSEPDAASAPETLDAGRTHHAATSGDDPKEWRDFVFPKIGGKNPDGTPRRVTTMFYTREVPMAMKHIEEQGGGVEGTVWGLADMAYNKMLIQPFVELFRNRNYFGAEIRDPWAPVIIPNWKSREASAPILDQTKSFLKDLWTGTQTGQFVKHIAEQEALPIGFTSAKRAADTGGDVGKEVPLAIMGFGPAPVYASRTPLENKIAALYREYVKPHVTPYEEAEIGNRKREARLKLQVAIQRGDTEVEQAARSELSELHARPFNANQSDHGRQRVRHRRR
jgi:hypothetical protein